MDKIRYSRLEMLEGIGPDGIKKLRNAKVLIIGCGALGSLCAMYLAASGVGTLGLVDFDTIDVSNLQRQLFFDELSLGKLKNEVLNDRICKINSNTRTVLHSLMINTQKASEIFPEYDFIIDGSDNPSTKKITSTVAEHLSLPYCIGGVNGFSGQVMSWQKGHTGYTGLFGDIPQCTGFTPCSLMGVLGPAAGVVASVQASEAIKYLTGTGQMLYDQLLTFDLRTNAVNIFGF